MEDARRVDVGSGMSAAMMSVAREPEESKADDFNQAMSVAMSLMSIYITLN